MRRLAGLYNEGGPEAMRDARRNNPGNVPLLNEEGRRALKDALDNEDPPGGGQWNGPKVAEWLSTYLGRHVWPSRGWDYLRYLDYSPQRKYQGRTQGETS